MVCPECRVAGLNGHLLGCRIAALTATRSLEEDVRRCRDLVDMAAAVARSDAMSALVRARELDRLATRIALQFDSMARRTSA